MLSLVTIKLFSETLLRRGWRQVSVLYSYRQYKCTAGENEETGEDDKVGDYEFEECVRVPGELKSFLNY